MWETRRDDQSGRTKHQCKSCRQLDHECDGCGTKYLPALWRCLGLQRKMRVGSERMKRKHRALPDFLEKGSRYEKCWTARNTCGPSMWLSYYSAVLELQKGLSIRWKMYILINLIFKFLTKSHVTHYYLLYWATNIKAGPRKASLAASTGSYATHED